MVDAQSILAVIVARARFEIRNKLERSPALFPFLVNQHMHSDVNSSGRGGI